MNRKELLAAGGIAAALAFGWYQFVWQSQGAAAVKADKDRTAAVEATGKLKTQVATLQRTQSQLESQKASVALINDAIPEDPDQSELYKILQSRAKEHKVALLTISAGQVTPPAAATGATGSAPAGSKANEMVVSLSLHGAYPDVVAFVAALSDLPRLLVVDSVSLQALQAAGKAGEAVGAGEVSVSIAARVFTTAEVPLAPGQTAVAPTTTAAAGATGAPASTAKAGTSGAATKAVP